MGITSPPANGAASMVADQKDWLVCHECGALQKDVHLHGYTQACCAKCGCCLRIHRERWVEPATALAVTAFLLFVACNAFTFLTVEIAGQTHSATLFSGVMALLERNQWLLASLVFATVFLYPLLELFALLYILVPFHVKKRLPGQWFFPNSSAFAFESGFHTGGKRPS